MSIIEVDEKGGWRRVEGEVPDFVKPSCKCLEIKPEE